MPGEPIAQDAQPGVAVALDTQRVAIFGSAAHGDNCPGSHVDIAVDIVPGKSFSLIRMQDTRLLLEDAIGQPVDLAEAAQFRPQLRAAFERVRTMAF